MKSIFSKNLIRFRKEKGLSQEQLAQKAGLTKRQIGYYENELDEDSILKNIEEIAKVLNIKMSSLFEENGNGTIDNVFDLDLDYRTIEKVKLILSLPRKERHIIYDIAECYATRGKLRQQEKEDSKTQ